MFTRKIISNVRRYWTSHNDRPLNEKLINDIKNIQQIVEKYNKPKNTYHYSYMFVLEITQDMEKIHVMLENIKKSIKNVHIRK
jgi:hypothetical protein